MAHSPAPWRIGKKQERAILDANGSQIAVLPESLKSDAALIAAAPELLEALKELKAWKDKNDPVRTSHFYLEKIMAKVESALAKAEGMQKLTFIDDNVPHTDDFVQKMIDHISYIKTEGNEPI